MSNTHVRSHLYLSSKVYIENGFSIQILRVLALIKCISTKTELAVKTRLKTGLIIVQEIGSHLKLSHMVIIHNGFLIQYSSASATIICTSILTKTKLGED